MRQVDPEADLGGLLGAEAPKPVAASAVGQHAVGVPSWLASQVEELGTVTAPAGELVLIDFGLLRLWSDESEPALDSGDVGEEVAVAANSAVDLEIRGDDPVAAGRATGLAAAEVARALVELELSGRVTCSDGLYRACGR